MAAATAAAATSAAPSSSSSSLRRRRERQLSGQHGSLRRYEEAAEVAGDGAGSETDSIESIYKQLSAPRKVRDSSFRHD